jgi:hypothetical protein
VISIILPERPTDDNVTLHRDPKGAIDGPRLGDQAKCVDPGRYIGKDAVVVVGEEGVLGVPVNCRKSEIRKL